MESLHVHACMNAVCFDFIILDAIIIYVYQQTCSHIIYTILFLADNVPTLTPTDEVPHHYDDLPSVLRTVS